MALFADIPGSITMVADSDYVFKDCYCRIVDPVQTGKNEIGIRVEVWLSKAARDEGGKQPIAFVPFYAPGILTEDFSSLVADANGNLLVAAYQWLKTQELFKEAIDA